MITPLSSLRYRFTGVMLVASLAFAVGVLTFVRKEIGVALETRTVEAASAILAGQARPVSDLVLVQDRISLREHTTEMARINARWLAIMVVDPRGQILAHAPDTPPAELTWSALATAAPGSRVRLDNRMTQVVVSPLVDERIGSMRAIVDLQPEAQAAQAALVRLTTALGVLTTAGVAVALLMGWWLTGPLMEMAAQARRIGAGDLGSTVTVPTPEDEVAVLARALNQMSVQLKVSRERELRQQQQMVQVERLAALGTFAAGTAHEVLNPLSGVAGCVRRLARAELARERRQHFADLALDALQRSSTVLRDLLTYARAEPAAAEWLSVAEVMKTVVDLAGREAAVEVQLVASPDVEALLPRGQLVQVVTNLLLNAQQAARQSVSLRWDARDGEVIVDVVDDGPGIDQAIQGRVFEPFFSTRQPGQGTGLGLSVSRSIVDALGGSVVLGPRPDGRSGVLARLRLPVEARGGDGT